MSCPSTGVPRELHPRLGPQSGPWDQLQVALSGTMTSSEGRASCQLSQTPGLLGGRATFLGRRTRLGLRPYSPARPYWVVLPSRGEAGAPGREPPLTVSTCTGGQGRCTTLMGHSTGLAGARVGGGGWVPSSHRDPVQTPLGKPGAGLLGKHPERLHQSKF